MKKLRSFRMIFAILVCFCMLVSVTCFVGADLGDFGGDGDYGGGDGGGDYGGGYSWDGDTRSSGSDEPTDPIVVVIVIAAFVIYGIYTVIKAKVQNKKGTNKLLGAETASDEDILPIDDYVDLDPQFDQNALEQKLKELYVQMQTCWTAKDLSSLRPYFSDALYARLDRQLDAHRAEHHTNYVENITVLEVSPSGFYQQAGMDHIIVLVSARITDYTLSDETGELLSGSKTAQKVMTYEYDMIRTSGKTSDTEENTQVTVCPNCGAPISINRTAKCPYCDSIITVEHQSFVIDNIKGVSQKTL